MVGMWFAIKLMLIKCIYESIWYFWMTLINYSEWIFTHTHTHLAPHLDRHFRRARKKRSATFFAYIFIRMHHMTGNASKMYAQDMIWTRISPKKHNIREHTSSKSILRISFYFFFEFSIDIIEYTLSLCKHVRYWCVRTLIHIFWAWWQVTTGNAYFYYVCWRIYTVFFFFLFFPNFHHRKRHTQNKCDEV